MVKVRLLFETQFCLNIREKTIELKRDEMKVRKQEAEI